MSDKIPVITMHTVELEVEKPQGGGGKGIEALYIVEVIVDGVKALHLQTHHFKKVGQMQAFADGMKALIAAAGGKKP